MSRKKTNSQFMILSAIGILFVVDAHAWSPLGIMAGVMPYNSFFMPMFIFISGYFFREKKLDNTGQYILKKAKTLLIPYFVWTLFYGILVNVLKSMGIIYYGEKLSLKTLFVEPWQNGKMFQINEPSWFVPVLFMVTAAYIILRKIIRPLWNDVVMMLIFFITGTLSVYLARHGYNTPVNLPWLKTLFFLQFYQLGVCYGRYVEKYYKKCPKFIIMLAAVLVNIILVRKYGDLSFIGLTEMSGFNIDNIFLPFITSVTGISFWLCAADILTPSLENNGIVRFISDNTFGLMMHHLFLFNVLNAIFYMYTKYISKNGMFDIGAFRSTAWYRYEYSYVYRWFYLIFAVLAYIFIKKLYDNVSKKVVSYIKNKRKTDAE